MSDGQLAVIGVGSVGSMADEREHVAVGVVGVDPGEALGRGAASPEGGGGAVRRVQIANGGVDAAVLGVVEQPPVELARLGPLGLLAELHPHEHQLFPGMCPHEGEVGAQRGQLLPAVAGHLPDQRPLAVDDLVVRQRQHEVLGEGVDE